ncbi:hypothetical protein RYX36_022024 [Vicia faba]
MEISDKPCGPLKYWSMTVFNDISAEMLRNFYMDNHYRKQWDNTVVEHNQLQLDESDGSEVGRTVKKIVCFVSKPKRRASVSYGGRSGGLPEKSQRSRSMSVSPDRARARGRSPAYNALAATFESSNVRNLSTPPPMIRKLYPKSKTPDSSSPTSKSSSISNITSAFERPSTRGSLFPRSIKETNSDNENSTSSIEESLTIQEDVKEGEAEDNEGLPVYPYESVNTDSTDPMPDIDVTKREAYLSNDVFKEKLGMARSEFYTLPKWKQNKLKMAVQLF